MRRPPTLLERQTAFLNTFNLLAEEIAPGFLQAWRAPAGTINLNQLPVGAQIVPMQQDIMAALVRASAMLVVGADLELPASPLRRDNLDGTTRETVVDLALGDHFAYPE